LRRQLIWDGVDPDGFKTLTKLDPLDTSTEIIPEAITAEHVSDRLLIIKDKSTVIATDILDYTSYDPILAAFTIDREGGDSILRVFNYAKGIVIVFGSRSISLLLNFTNDPSDAQVEMLNSSIGLAGRKAAVMLGGDVLFLSQPGGIYRIAQAFENRYQAIAQPLTDCIEPLIARINWPEAAGAVAASCGEYVYFAVPIDGATGNNCVIVINGITGIVEGYDTFSGPMQIDDFVVTIYHGVRKLYALNKETATIYVMYEGNSDFVYDPDTDTTTEYPILDVIETRGFSTLGWNAATRRDFKRVEFGVSTWSPALQITELTETANDERALSSNPVTKSRTEYYTFGRPDYSTSNDNDDWATPGREDYSMIADDVGFVPGSGIDFDQKQACTLRFSTKARGKYISYRIANSQGQADIQSCLLESSGTQRELRRGG
jgi:hypothetical protein